MFHALKKHCRYMVVPTFLINLIGCGGGGASSGGGNLPVDLPDYVGTWVANCTSDWPTYVFTLSINASGQYFLISNEYDSEANCGDDAYILNTSIDTATVSSIEANTANAAYKDIFVSISETRKTAHATSEVSNWISTEYCGKTDWSIGTEATFTTGNPGTGAGGTCYQSSSRPAVLLNGSVLSVNGRGGFDGSDPADVVYSKQSDTPLLSGFIDGSPWVVVSGKASLGYDAGLLLYSLYDTYVPDICNTIYFSSRSSVLFSRPDASGDYPLGFDYTVTLYDGTTNYLVTSGTSSLQSVTSTEITGNIGATYNSNYTVSGSFTVSRCTG